MPRRIGKHGEGTSDIITAEEMKELANESNCVCPITGRRALWYDGCVGESAPFWYPTYNHIKPLSNPIPGVWAKSNFQVMPFQINQVKEIMMMMVSKQRIEYDDEEDNEEEAQ